MTPGAVLPRSVLLADGSPGARARGARVFREDRRFELCACADTAASAVALALEHRPDVAVLDEQMPGGGIAAAREIAARLPETRIVILVDDLSDQEALFAALHAGASGYLQNRALRGRGKVELRVLDRGEGRVG